MLTPCFVGTVLTVPVRLVYSLIYCHLYYPIVVQDWGTIGQCGYSVAVFFVIGVGIGNALLSGE